MNQWEDEYDQMSRESRTVNDGYNITLKHWANQRRKIKTNYGKINMNRDDPKLAS